jgi:hypothetical protein
MVMVVVLLFSLQHCYGIGAAVGVAVGAAV